MATSKMRSDARFAYCLFTTLTACSSFVRFDAGNDVAHGDANDDRITDALDPSIAAPRQIAPLSTSIVTSRRSTLQWLLPAGVDGAHVEICRDRGCGVLIAALDATGSSAVPTSDLPAGIVYWRARGRLGTATGLATSPTWQFTVGARSAPVDSSSGTVLDVNGDGYADIVVGSYNAMNGTGRAHLYLGGAAGIATTPSTSLNGPDVGGNFGARVASAGDVNGDGYADVVIGEPIAASATGRAHLYLGGPAGLATTPTASLDGLDAHGQFGSSVSSAGDVNADGYADVVIGARGAMDNDGRAYVYLGGPAGPAMTPAISLDPPDRQSQFGLSLASADVNGDGYADVLVGAYNATANTGRAHLYLGSRAGLSTSPSMSLTGPDGPGGNFGVSVASAGDVNGDGYADVIIGAFQAMSGAGRAHFYLGGSAGLSTAPATSLTGPDAGGTFGISVSGVGDVNGDGFPDVLVGAHGAMNNTGRVHLFFGGSGGLAATPAISIAGRDAGGLFGFCVAGAGDINGDGYADAVVGAFLGAGSATLLVGGAAGFATASAASLAGPDGPQAQFGYWVATAGSEVGTQYTNADRCNARNAQRFRPRGTAQSRRNWGMTREPAVTPSQLGSRRLDRAARADAS